MPKNLSSGDGAVKVIGIDPAPSKKSTSFDGENFRSLTPEELKKDLDQYRKENALICWDAPLTGHCDFESSSFSDRLIEKALRKVVNKRKGVSVLPYCGCPHWAITRYMLGLPKTGPYDLEDLPFEMAEDAPHPGRPQVAEVHPAVAMYFWIGEAFVKYKGNLNKAAKANAIEENWNALKQQKAFSEFNHLESGLDKQITSDDELDALVAYVLGEQWTTGTGEVKLLGGSRYGSMLLPCNNILYEKAEEQLKTRQATQMD